MVEQGSGRVQICSGGQDFAAKALGGHVSDRVLAGAGVGLGGVIKLGVYVTDADKALKNFDLMGMRFGPTGNKPPMMLLKVSRLAVPGLMFEIEATAAD